MNPQGSMAALQPDGATAAAGMDGMPGMVDMPGMASTTPSSPTASRSDAGMPGMVMDGDASSVGFPYAFPSPGTYRLWVQVKVAGRVQTGVFDTTVH